MSVRMTVNKFFTRLQAYIDLQRLVDLIEYSRVYLALGDTLWAFALALLLDVEFGLQLGAIVFFSVFGVYALNRRTDRAEDAVNLDSINPGRATTMSFAGAVSLGGASVIALLSEPLVLVAIGWAVLCFVVYSVPVLPRQFGVRRAKEVPGVKNLTVAVGLAGAIFLVLLFPAGGPVTTSMVVLFLFVVGRVVIGSIIPDVRDMAGDEAAKITTVPVVLGIHRTKQVLFVLNLAVTALVYGAISAGILPRIAVLPGLVNLIAFPLIGGLTRDNAQIAALFSDVNDTYVFFLLTLLSAVSNGGIVL